MRVHVPVGVLSHTQVLLKDSNVDPNCEEKGGETALDKAQDGEFADAIAMLEKVTVSKED